MKEVNNLLLNPPPEEDIGVQALFKISAGI